MNVRVVLYALIGLGLFSCADQCRKMQRKDPSGAYISLERTACFGTCPVDVYTLYINGHQRYEGRMFTLRKGEHMADLNPDAACGMFKRYDKLGWEQWDSLYPTMYSDLPSYIVRYQYKKRKREIVVSGEHPEELQSLIEDLLSLSEEQVWKATTLQ